MTVKYFRTLISPNFDPVPYKPMWPGSTDRNVGGARSAGIGPTQIAKAANLAIREFLIWEFLETGDSRPSGRYSKSSKNCSLDCSIRFSEVQSVCWKYFIWSRVGHIQKSEPSAFYHYPALKYFQLPIKNFQRENIYARINYADLTHPT